MFTGIIETLGEILAINTNQENVDFVLKSSISNELKVDQSVAHDGVCLTVTSILPDCHQVTAVKETLEKTNLGGKKIGDKVNIERCMLNNGRFDGHIVQGHVDTIGKVTSIKSENGSWRFTFQFPTDFSSLIVDKGSICVNGTSLTCFNVTLTTFDVAIIPYTYENTSISQLSVNSWVNLEFDIIGKYVEKMLKN